MGHERYFWFWKVPLDLCIEGLLPRGRTLRVRALGMDEHALRLLYEIEPPVERGRLWPDMCLWLLSARDDLGADYADFGGAIGTSDDRLTTDGIRSLSPLPPDGAAWLDVAFNDPEAHPGAPPVRVVRVAIPPW